jgi:hypothetical protein
MPPTWQYVIIPPPRVAQMAHMSETLGSARVVQSRAMWSIERRSTVTRATVRIFADGSVPSVAVWGWEDGVGQRFSMRTTHRARRR